MVIQARARVPFLLKKQNHSAEQKETQGLTSEAEEDQKLLCLDASKMPE
jgi:hypothetical protein